MSQKPATSVVDETGSGSSIDVFVKQRWTRRTEYIMSCISMSVGLGNFWRFPYVCYKHGGGAYLLAYIIVIIFIGKPFYELDSAMGQYSSKGSIVMYYRLGPAWQGLGITQFICAVNVASYYAFIIALSLFYMGKSFTTSLPWNVCEPKWGNNCLALTSATTVSGQSISSSEYYMKNIALNELESVENGLGNMNWSLVICLFVTWMLACINVIYGIKSSAKISYFLALFPYVVMIVLLIKGCMLEGAMEGIMFFVKPNFTKLADEKMWVDAITQCFFSLGVGYGIDANYASFNDIHEDIDGVALIISSLNTLTSVLAGFTIFSAMGGLALRLHTTVPNVVKGSGMMLAFVTYTDAISTFGNGSFVFSVIFFFMLIVLGMGSLSSYQQLLSTNIMELMPRVKAWQAAITTSAIGFITGLVYCTQGGQLVFGLVDLYGTVYVLALVSFLQFIAIIYVYGLQEWAWDMDFMTRRPLNIFTRICWATIIPVIMIFIYVESFLLNELQYRGEKPPIIALYCGYILLILVCLPMPLNIICYLVKYRREGACRMAFNSDKWLPADAKLAAKSAAFSAQKRSVYKYKDRSCIVRFFAALGNKSK